MRMTMAFTIELSSYCATFEAVARLEDLSLDGDDGDFLGAEDVIAADVAPALRTRR